MPKTRPFDANRLTAFAVPDIRPPMGVGALVWRYVDFLPLSERKIGEEAGEQIADSGDIDNLLTTLSNHFSGLTILPAVMGYGLREPDDPTSLELNRNLPFLVYARPVAASDRYFARLQQELREAFDQGVILIERQEAFLFASAEEKPQAARQGKRRSRP